MRSEQEVNRAIERYADTVRRLCVVHLKNEADAEDIFQNVFLKYALSTGDFESEEHERAWMIRVTINACKDLLKSFFRSRKPSPSTKWWSRRRICTRSTGRCSRRFFLCPKNIATSSTFIITKAIRRPRLETFCRRNPTRFTPF